jgi:diguanylate cyclase (GGDEF)-like protein/PAS domain S-box-containing protein
MSAPTTAEREHQELAQFVYLMPLAVARFGESGVMESFNPAAARLLRGLDIAAAGADLHGILDRLGPGLSDRWRASAGRVGVVIPAHDCTVLPGKGPAVHLLLRVLRPDQRCTMITLDDLTPLVEQGRELDRQRRRAEVVLEHIPGYCVALLDQSGKVTEWNLSIGRFFGVSANAMVGRPLWELLTATSGEPSSFRDFLDVRNLIARQGWCRVDASWRKHGGQEMWGDCVVAPVVEADGSIGGYVAVIRDITVEHISTQELIDAALTDPLTGLYNRRGLEGRSEALHSRPGGAQFDQVWIMLDVDSFKGINDTHGHEAGDEVLRTVAEALRATARGADILARLGGDEFVLVLPDTSTELALRIAERLRTAIESASTTVDGRVIRVTGSFGIAQRAVQDTLPEVLERADAALYASKKGGRNRVTIAERSC